MLDLRKTKTSIAALLRTRIARNLAWLAGADVATRAVRLLSVAIVARILGPEAFGVAALLLSSHELVKVGAQIGTGQSIIRAHADELEAVSKASWQLNILVCAVLAGIQLAIGWMVGGATGHVSAPYLGMALALVFLGMPLGLVHVFRALRDERADEVARIAAAQNIADCVLTVVLALAGAGVWALVLPKVLTMPIWLVCVRRLVKWQPQREVQAAAWGPILKFGLPILGSEALAAVRLNLDKPIIGAVLGVEAAGLWYLATSAGLGLTQAVSSAFSLILMPFLCKDEEGQSRRERFDRFAWTALPALTAVFVVQAVAAPLYVPILFGNRWDGAVAIVAVLCLTGAPRLLWESVVQLARSEGRSGAEFAGNALIGTAALLALLAGAQLSLLAAAIALAAVTGGAQLILSICLRFVGLQMTPSSQTKELQHA
ncbi:oligosaccharide flippase family protein [Parvularcula sp. ZS-1/3]|uniref:Oligosaccharide flippase family protein n=1 Tax=Parvularcula mediterranea TaxID=2732508 RepID=A0A7Y3W5D8_9PROT|nr:oligosaccharide flippase family protein [Parvularcula mediterranea]